LPPRRRRKKRRVSVFREIIATALVIDFGISTPSPSAGHFSQRSRTAIVTTLEQESSRDPALLINDVFDNICLKKLIYLFE